MNTTEKESTLRVLADELEPGQKLKMQNGTFQEIEKVERWAKTYSVSIHLKSGKHIIAPEEDLVQILKE
jgi:hypothetical protein